MIRGMHGMFHTSDAEASRAFVRDVLALPFTDVGGGWLLFDLPQADVGFHPTKPEGGPPAGTHDVSFFCDDIKGTVAKLRARGVRFTGDPVDQGYGFVTSFEIPGGIRVQLYEPKYQKKSSKPPSSVKRVKKAPQRAAKKKAAKAKSKSKPKPKRKGARR